MRLILNGMLDVEESKEFLFLMIFDMIIILNNLKFIKKLINKIRYDYFVCFFYEFFVKLYRI